MRIFLISLLFLILSSSAQAAPVNIYCEDFKGYTYYFDENKNSDHEFIDDKSEGLKLSLLLNGNKSLISYLSTSNKQARNNEMDGDELKVFVYKTIPTTMRIEIIEVPGENSVNLKAGIKLFYAFNLRANGTGEVIKTTYRMNSTLPKVSVEKGDCKIGVLPTQ